MVRQIKYLLLAVIIFPLLISAQSEEITGRQDELQQLKIEINNLETELRAKTKKEQQSLESLQIFTKQGLYLNKIINKIRTEESLKEKEIRQTRKNINEIENEIKNIRELYTKYVIYLYKYGKADVLSFLVNSESLNQAFLRYRYFSRITERNKHNLEKLEESKKELTVLKDKLQTELDEQHRLAEQKKSEERELSGKISERQKVVKQLKNNKDALKKEIELKRRSEQEIRNIIARLVEEEQRKAEEKRLAEQRRKAELLAKEKNPEITKEIKPPVKEEIEKTPVGSYTSLVKGRLGWPVESGKIVRKFGENRNERLNTVTMNYGVDIKTSVGAGVKAVAGGVVSSVTWLPGYGSIIILTHKDNYRTVYGHLGEIYVNEDTEISPGKIIGTVAEGLEGSILHFEIWSERVNQNPELWLVKK